MLTPPVGDTWTGLSTEALPVDLARSWAVVPSTGAVVVFAGTVRDHAEGRPGVIGLDYEAYAEHVDPKLAEIVEMARCKWPGIKRAAILHRMGSLALTETSVVVAVSSAHREEAFEAARFGIEMVKTTVPIWKRETWQGGSDWSSCDHELAEGAR